MWSYGGDHFYTTSQEEATRAKELTTAGYLSEQIACYVYKHGPSTAYLQRRAQRFSGQRLSEDGVLIGPRPPLPERRSREPEHPGTVPLYRLINVAKGDHLYTIYEQERDDAIKSFDYVNEGIACLVYRDAGENRVPFYRTLNPVTGDHFYTTSQAERDNATSNLRHKDEGIACYVYNTQVTGTGPLYRLANSPILTVPLYRLCNLVTGDHFYCRKAEERAAKLADPTKWRDEDSAGYVFPQEVPGTVPLYRLYRSDGFVDDHFYCVSDAEAGMAQTQGGYMLEGVEGWVYDREIKETVPLFRLLKLA
jgi:hypothetical protein